MLRRTHAACGAVDDDPDSTFGHFRVTSVSSRHKRMAAREHRLPFTATGSVAMHRVSAGCCRSGTRRHGGYRSKRDRWLQTQSSCGDRDTIDLTRPDDRRSQTFRVTGTDSTAAPTAARAVLAFSTYADQCPCLKDDVLFIARSTLRKTARVPKLNTSSQIRQCCLIGRRRTIPKSYQSNA